MSSAASAPLAQNMAPVSSYGSTGELAMAPTQAVMMPPTLYEVMDKEPGVQIRRQMRLLEELIGYEQNNKYVVRNLPKPGQEDGDTEYLLAAEKSTWCERNCYPPDCAPWRMDIYSLPSGKDDKSMLHIEKPCQCTFCCLNRPEIFITDPNTGAAVASIKDPFACCDMTIDVKDTNGEVLFHTVGGCCQCGLHCPCPGQEVNFQIQDPTTKEEVAHLKKIWMLGDLPVHVERSRQLPGGLRQGYGSEVEDSDLPGWHHG